jgi:multicomponent Na+:H+ antiporter subunit B
VTRRARLIVFFAAASGLAALFGWAFAGLPSFGDYQGPYGFVLNRVAVPERHVTNVVAATVFDYRAFDTLGEEFILFTAVTGIVMLLREGERGTQAERESRYADVPGLRLFGALAVALALLVGFWLAAFGYVTPGGGFQGGVVVASGLVLLYFATRYRTYAPFGNVKVLDPLEGIGAGGFAVIGVVALLSGLPFLTNLFGPGTVGTLLSGGSIAFLNWAAALEVSAALLVLFAEFLQEYVVPLAQARR